MSTALRTHPAAPNATRLLARVLEEPGLAEAIRELAPAELGALVQRIGLEDAGEVVALATTEQLVGAFDEDLWRNERPGEQESFDPARFVLWLEIMMEAGEAFVGSRLSELPEDLLTLALHEQVLVLEVDGLAERMLEDGDPDEIGLLDKALTSCLYEELDEYQLIARHPEGWDTVLAAVLALDRDHGALLRRVLDRCVAMSSEFIDDNGGLYEVLTAEEMLGEDVAAEREGRRAASGYVAPSDATSFLKLAASKSGAAPGERDAVTRAWFRELDRRPAPAPARSRSSEGLRALLSSPGRPGPSLPLLTTGGGEAGSRRGRGRERPDQLVVMQAMQMLAVGRRKAFDQRQEELAYLANVLVAGATIEGRRVRPIEAIRAAMAVVGAGLDYESAPGSKPMTPETMAELLACDSLDRLFRVGWARLHSEAAAAGRSRAFNELDVVDARSSPRKPGASRSRKPPAGAAKAASGRAKGPGKRL